MGGSRIFDWGGPCIEEAQDAGQNVAIFSLKSWLIGGALALCPPPLEPPLVRIGDKLIYVLDVVLCICALVFSEPCI